MAELTPLEKLRDAVQAFVNDIDDEAPVLLAQCVLVWETMVINEDGDVARKVSYSVPSDQASQAGTVGLLALGQRIVEQQLLDVGDAE